MNTVTLGQTSPSITTVNYGTDLANTGDLDPNMIEVSGVNVLAQALVRRLLTPRGALIDDPNYGYYLVGEVGDDIGPGDVGRIAAQMDAEFLKDSRVSGSRTTAAFIGGVLTTSSVITSSLGPFPLVLAATQVTVTILKAPQ